MKILVADDDPTSQLVARAMVERLGHHCIVVSDGIQAWEAFQLHRPDVVITDWVMPGLSGVELCQKIRENAAGSFTYCILVTSLGARTRVLQGMLAGADDYLVKPLNADDLQMRLIAATRVASLHRQLDRQRDELEALNAELTGMTLRDPLTGLGNRRALAQELDRLQVQVDRYGTGYSVALFDLDHFKAYNDTYGHLAGDVVLQTTAAQLREQARSGDTLYRYGGEEFLCILPEQSLAGGVLAAQRMGAGLEALAIPHVGNATGTVTMSVGVAELDPRFPRAADEVLREADAALYDAKGLGRNRVAFPGSRRVSSS